MECKSFNKKNKFFIVIGWLTHVSDLEKCMCNFVPAIRPFKVVRLSIYVSVSRFSGIWLCTHSKKCIWFHFYLMFVFLWVWTLVPSSSLLHPPIKINEQCFLLLPVMFNDLSRKKQAMNFWKFFWFLAHNSQYEHIRRRKWKSHK